MNKTIIILFVFGIYFTELSGQVNTQNNTMSQGNQNMLSPADVFYFTETMTFLKLPVSAESYLLGNTGAARITDDPMAFAINPAQLGMRSFKTKYVTGYNFINSFHYFNTWHKSMAVNAGFRLGDFINSSIPLSFGIGYANLYNQYIKMMVFWEERLQRYKEMSPNEKEDLYSIGVGLDYAIKVSAGATYKHCVVDFGETLKKNLYDFGLLIHLPIHEILSGSGQNTKTDETGFDYSADVSLGYSRSNLGSDAISEETRMEWFNVYKYKTAVPSSIQTGFSTIIGLQYNQNNVTWQPLNLSYSIEEKDILSYSSGNTVKHQGIMGDINFFQDIIMGRTNLSTTKHKGFRVDLGEMVSLFNGSSEGGYYYPTLCEEINGWAINSKGFFKVLAMFTPDIVNTKAGYIFQHLSVKCTFGKAENSKITIPYYYDDYYSERKFYSINISWSNW
ncbi:MAG: hypothetical protein HY965_03570 [Ignavibacteriales bacterium]|nr:hypothetical protein [Ignavibacteriales bacterium]